MPFSFSREEVRRHLVELGYVDVDDDKLEEFYRDLKRLAKYEEKQDRKKKNGKLVFLKDKDCEMNLFMSKTFLNNWKRPGIQMFNVLFSTI